MNNNFFFLVFLFLFSQIDTKLHGQKSYKTEVAYFASGCFWCVEAIYDHVKGVEDVVSGYAGGHTKNPTYESTGTGKTGHAETVAVYYNPTIVNFQTLVKVYFGTQDPTTFGQHPDYGSPYRSIVFYSKTEEKNALESFFLKLNKEVYKGEMVTEIKMFEHFYKAEEYHQNFEKLHPDHNYIRAVSIPRLNRFKKDFPELVK